MLVGLATLRKCGDNKFSHGAVGSMCLHVSEMCMCFKRYYFLFKKMGLCTIIANFSY